jgi:hypothetical protein
VPKQALNGKKLKKKKRRKEIKKALSFFRKRSFGKIDYCVFAGEGERNILRQIERADSKKNEPL